MDASSSESSSRESLYRQSFNRPPSTQEFIKKRSKEKPSDEAPATQLANRAASTWVTDEDLWHVSDDAQLIDQHSAPELASRTTPRMATTTTVTMTMTTTITTSTAATHNARMIDEQNRDASITPLRSQTLRRQEIRPENAITEAIRESDCQRLQTLIKDHPGLLNTILPEQNQTPLTFAAQNKNQAVVRFLLTCENIDIDHPGANGSTALHTASASGDLALLRTLLAAGANPDTVDNNGCTPLITAAACEKKIIVNTLLTILKKPSQVNRQDKRGYTALTYAAVTGDLAITKRLLAHGANSKIANNEGHSPMTCAMENQHDKVMLSLLEHDRRFRSTWPAPPVLLAFAIDKGHAPLLDKLLSMGAKLDSTVVDPVFTAADKGHADVIYVLHQHGYPINQANQTGKTPLITASADGNTEIVNLLISLGADLDHRDHGGLSALDVAVAIGGNKTLREPSHYETIFALISHIRGPICISKQVLKPLTSIAINQVNESRDWGILNEILAKGLITPDGETLYVDLEGLKDSSHN